jgi:hypothetical protein
LTIFRRKKIFSATLSKHERCHSKQNLLAGPCHTRGCQMAYFKTKNPNLGKFWRVLQWKMLVYLLAIWSILRPFGIFCDHLVHFAFIWYIFSAFGIMYQEKSGNPGHAGTYIRGAPWGVINNSE